MKLFLILFFLSVINNYSQHLIKEFESSFNATRIDSSFKAYYWWNGQEDYAAGSKDTLLYNCIINKNERSIEVLPVYSDKLKKNNVDSTNYINSSKITMKIDSTGNLLDIVYPKLVELKLSYLTSNEQIKQKAHLFKAFESEWYFGNLQFRNFDLSNNDTIYIKDNFFIQTGDSLPHSGMIFRDTTFKDPSNKVKLNYIYEADSSKLSQILFAKLKDNSAPELNDTSFNRILYYGKVIEGNAIFEINPTRMLKRESIDKLIEYRADSTQTMWKTISQSKFIYQE